MYSVSDSAYSEEASPAGEYAAMFTTEIDQIFIVYQIREGIVRIDTMFSPTSRDAVIQLDASEMILHRNKKLARLSDSNCSFYEIRMGSSFWVAVDTE